MELMAFWCSPEFDLSMQQLSTQKYCKPSLAACSPQNCILPYPAFPWPKPWTISLKVTSWSSSSHRCERIAYRGVALSGNRVRQNSPFGRSCKRRIIWAISRGLYGEVVENGSTSTVTVWLRRNSPFVLECSCRVSHFEAFISDGAESVLLVHFRMFPMSWHHSSDAYSSKQELEIWAGKCLQNSIFNLLIIAKCF